METDNSVEKRNVPPWLQNVLAYDVKLTKRFVSFSLNFVPIRSLKKHCLFLEYSCHGLVWLTVWLAIAWLIDRPNLYEMQINMLIGLILDIFIVAVIKAATRRRRPTVNQEGFSIGPDKFSFPSGHASRSFLILLFFTVLDPISYIFWPSIFAWAVCVTVSRILLYRHHILDIVGGILLGCVEAMVLSVIWLEKDTAKWVMSWLSDENLPGSAVQEDTF